MRAFLIRFLFLALVPFNAAGETYFTFADAARLAVENSRELRNEYSAKALREGVWLWGARAFLPRFSITGSEDDRVSEIGTDSFHKNYSVNVDQLLWDGGRLLLARRMERAELDLAGNRLKQLGTDIAEAAVSSYRDVLQGRKVLEIQKKTLESLNEQRRILQRELELGLVRQIDLVEAEITVALTELEINSLSMDLMEAERRLAERLGLETLPFLSEQIDTSRSTKLLPLVMALALAEGRNPELAAFRYSLVRRQAELRSTSLSWLPTLRLTGSFGLSGRQYPLFRHSWSVGVNIDFSSPWISGSTGTSFGKDPPYDKNARLQQTVLPAPNPAEVFSVRHAELNLRHERSVYETAIKEVLNAVERGIIKCELLDKKRLLIMQTLDWEREKLHIAELKLSLGEIRRIDLMEALLDYAKREVALVEAATLVLQAERELERLLDLAPGELSALAERSVI